ncbi:TonB-linked outer membrane protein, SusC/RagA family [Chryseobacterium indoltheticum]|uniref:TonB-linked outer membrane protein, SusC/RagA family n=1 Tax=Chryseobacterium indoltheticum TaxID=254 RepID=A0ABY1JK60_9FLAO|nr:SusC/RagA family TonB-linked outer membrane protein [Chryseobacterium indoltheticum]SIQ31245.1 TonB-linked outer membrane protein, SusC/RagA family [Chryseobacterium indoltheticum]
MKQTNLKYSCLIAVLYFGMNVNGQVAPKDTVAKEQKIEEVVLIGYGTQKKENITGSIGLVTAKDLADKPNSNPLSSVQGKLAGVNITNTGTPGGSPRVDIRGVGSLTGNTVFIVDGMITTDISYLNPQDIESMSVLKDPSSLAIFGAQAANGAVIIKTKTGKGKPVYNFNSYIGFKKVTNIPKMVNSDQYIELYNEKLINDNGSSAGSISRANFPADTDWYKEIFRTSIINANDFSATGSIGKLNYYGSLGYLQDEGNLAAGSGINSGSGFNRFNSKLNLSYKITDNITIGNNFSFSKMRTDISANPLLTAFIAPPIFSTINPTTGDYQYFDGYNIANPRAQLDLYRSQRREERLLNNVFGEVKFLKDFTARISYSSDSYSPSQYEFTPTLTYIPDDKETPSTLVTRNYRNRNYVWDNTINWKKSFGNHNFDVLAGFSRTRTSVSQDYWSARGVNYNGTNESLNINNGTGLVHHIIDVPDLNVDQDQQRIESFFGRLNYDYKGKYLINGSIRRDASSQVSVDRARVFPAVSAGWVVSKEDFMSGQNVFNLLKLRASYGELGNPNIGRGYTANISQILSGAYFGNVGAPATTVDQFIDPNIGWETTTGKDVGIEMALFNNKLKIDAAYYDKDSKNVVYGVNQGTVSGAANWRNFVTNAYSFNNRGFEVSVNYNTKLSDNVSFGVYGNFTSLKNEITSVYLDSYLETGASLFGNSIIRLEKGHAVGSYYGYDVAGVFQTDAEAAASGQPGAKAGWFKFADQDGNGVIDTRDKTFLGSPIPKGTYGFGVNFNVYAFDIAVDFQGVFGNKIYNYNREQRYGNETWDLDMYNNRWNGAGTSNTNSMITSNQLIIAPNSFYVEDGSYIRIRNIQVGYNLPKSFANALSITKLRLYVSAQNPWTSFKYNGFSPEITNTDRVQMGIDNNIYPISAIYTMGMNLTF